MKLKITLLFTFLSVSFSSIFGQNQELKLTEKDSTIVSSWIAGIGFNAVDDSGREFDKLLEFEDEWNVVPFPSRLSIGKYFKNGLGVEAIAAYNKYKKDKIVDGSPIADDKDYFSLDTRLSYDLNKLVGETGWFDPYVGVGIGYTKANDNARATYNGVVGFRTWFSDRFGLDINSSGKWAMNTNYTNHLQHAVGVVYRFAVEKELTKEGEEKLVQIKALEKEKDSIAAANIAKEKAMELEKKLAEERENARLAQLEKEKQEAREKKLNDIQNQINNIGNVYFGYDSSIINTSSKNILSKLSGILDTNPELKIEIGSHTDSRGSKTYNQLLSEQRLKSTLDYLLNIGVAPDKVSGKAYGEDKLLNDCDDATKCSEIKHKENRRSEIKVINY